MKQPRLRGLIAAALPVVAMSLAAPTYAQGYVVPRETPREIAGIGNVAVLSGGLGIRERDALAQEARNFNLKLVFAMANGDYLADVPVQIVDRYGRPLVDTLSSGPWMFVDLPPGSYTVRATLNGITKVRTIGLAPEPQSIVHFNWTEAERLARSRY